MSDSRVELLREFFFSRTDFVSVAAPWNRGKPCPVNVDSDEHLLALLNAHVLGGDAPEVEVHYTTQRGPGEAAGRYRLGSYTPAPTDNTTAWLCLDFDGPGHRGAHLIDPFAAARAVPAPPPVS